MHPYINPYMCTCIYSQMENKLKMCVHDRYRLNAGFQIALISLNVSCWDGRFKKNIFVSAILQRSHIALKSLCIVLVIFWPANLTWQSLPFCLLISQHHTLYQSWYISFSNVSIGNALLSLLLLLCFLLMVVVQCILSDTGKIKENLHFNTKNSSLHYYYHYLKSI